MSKNLQKILTIISQGRKAETLQIKNWNMRKHSYLCKKIQKKPAPNKAFKT